MDTTNQSDNAAHPSRRDFIRTSTTAVAAAAVLAGRPVRAATPKLRVGLVGCGGRGSGAAVQALRADPDTEMAALGDVFADQLEHCLHNLTKADVGERVNVPKKRQFVGFDAFEKVIEHSDVVLLATPPHFRPQHLKACIDAGKHVFCEKPVAVDPPGVRSVLETCERAKTKGLNVVTGLCYRYEFAKRETMQRVHDGAIGDIVALQTTYNTGALWHRGDKPEWSEMEYQIRNWLYFDWLSGDHIAEQHIHSLDKLAWAMQDAYPVKATSSGGRIQRIDPKYGNVYDHFNTVYEWSNGVRGFSSCRQWANADTDVSDFAYGTDGTAALQSHRVETRDGSVWQHEKAPGDDMYQNEHDALFAAIRKGEPINNGRIMSYSTLMAIMGRMSAYSGRTVTQEEVLNRDLRLGPEAYAWGDVAVNPVARPGVES